jgi:hypothetical protein
MMSIIENVCFLGQTIQKKYQSRKHEKTKTRNRKISWKAGRPGNREARSDELFLASKLSGLIAFSSLLPVSCFLTFRVFVIILNVF